MGITKSTNPSTIPCGGTVQVTLALTAEPDIVSNPTDIVLILDRSGSMAKSLPALKSAADLFIDIIDEATDGTQDGQIGNGSRIGVVSFSSTAAQDTQLITSAAALKSAVDGLMAGGFTNLKNDKCVSTSISTVGQGQAPRPTVSIPMNQMLNKSDKH